eukprot:Phypoly_transcript_30952.p1 GENE.Phypoly_transcript_30952~~Phypoly_transcript_30952.p1  ORF type:complete len:102 (+),score=8.94 Phypoly_transcript_30952:91-396(+)
MSDIISLGFGLLVALGGVAGYVTKQSVPSLVAGVTTGSIVVYASQLAATNPRLANQLILGVCALLTVVMGLRFKNTGKVMPAGVVALLSILMAVRSFFGLQ